MTPEEQEQLREGIEKLKQEFEHLSGPVFEKVLYSFKGAFESSKNIETALGSARRTAGLFGSELKNVRFSARSIYDQLRGVTSELKGQSTVLSKMRGSFRKVEEVAQNLKLDEEGNLDLTRLQVDKLQEKLAKNQAIIDQEAEMLSNSNIQVKRLNSYIERLSKEKNLTEEIQNSIADQIASGKHKIELEGKTIANVGKLKDEERSLLLYYYDQENVGNKLKQITEERVQLEKEINKYVGVTGAVVEGTGALMERLGMRTGMFHDAMKESSATMREMAKNTALNLRDQEETNKRYKETLGRIDKINESIKSTKGHKKQQLISEKKGLEELKKTQKTYSKIQIAAAGLGKLIKGFSGSLLDPVVILGAIAHGFVEINKSASELQRYIGTYESTLAGTQGQTITLLKKLNTKYASSVQFLETTLQLTKETARNALALYPPEVIARVTELKNTLGLAVEEAAGLASISALTGKSIDRIGENIVDTVSSYNGANRVALSHRIILEDVSKATDDIKASLSANPELLAKSAAAARKLGMDLNQLNQIADTFLDFESSIRAELEAQLLTGRKINLNKAREAALSNDLAAVGEEISRSMGNLAQFSETSRISQQGLAKALGLSREQLGRAVYLRAKDEGMTEKQAAAAAQVNFHQMQALDIQAKMRISIQKLQQAMAPMLDILIPIVEVLGRVLTKVANISAWFISLGEKITNAKGEVTLFGSIIGSIGKLISGSLLIGVVLFGKKLILALSPLRLIKNLVKGAVKSLKSLFALGKGKSIFGNIFKQKSEVTEAASKLKEGVGGKDSKIKSTVKSTENIDKVKEPKSSGEKIKMFLKNLSEGLRSMGQKGVLKGALNLVPTGVGFVALLPGLPGIKLSEKIDGIKLKKGLLGLAEGVKSLGNSKTLLGALNLIPISLGFIALIPGMIGIKLAEFVNGVKLTASLTGLAVGLQSLSSPKVLLGAAALTLTSIGFIAMIPALPAMALLGVIGPSAAAGLAVLGPALGSFGAAALPAIPIMLAFTGVAIGLGFALKLAAPTIESFGNTVKNVFKGISTLISTAVDSFIKLSDSISLKAIKNFYLLGPALLVASAGLVAFGASAALAVPGMMVIAGGITVLSKSLDLLLPRLTSIGDTLSTSLDNVNQSIIKTLSNIKSLTVGILAGLSLIPIKISNILVRTKETVLDVGSKIKDSLISVFSELNIKGLIGNLTADTVNMLESTLVNLRSKIENVVSSIKNITLKIKREVIKLFKEVGSRVEIPLSLIPKITVNVKDKIVGSINTTIKAVKDKAFEIKEALSSTIRTIEDVFKNINISDIADKIKNTVSNIKSTVGEVISNVVIVPRVEIKNILDKVGKIKNTIKNTVEGIKISTVLDKIDISNLISKIKNTVSNVKRTISELFSSIETKRELNVEGTFVTSFSKIESNIKKAVKSGRSLLESVKVSFFNFLIKSKETFSSMFTNISEIVEVPLGLINSVFQNVKKVIKSILTGIPEMFISTVEKVTDSIIRLISSVTGDNIKSILSLGPALMSVASGITVLSASLLGNKITSFFRGDMFTSLSRISTLSEPLQKVSASLQNITSSVSTLSASITSLQLDRLEKLTKLLKTVSFSNPIKTKAEIDQKVTVSSKRLSPEKSQIETVQSVVEKNNTTVIEESNKANEKLIRKLEELIETVKEGGDVYLDSKKVGSVLMMSMTNLS